VFLVWNDTCTLFSILNIFNKPKNLIHIWDYILWFNSFLLTSPAPQSDFEEESYGSLKLVGLMNGLHH
jgi:hypothetical protein